MEAAYELEIYDSASRDQFEARFAALAPDTDPAVQARRRWWCFDNPHGGAFALFHNGERIAATCYLGGKVILGGTGAGYEIGETATDPRDQRRGLFSRLVKAAVDYAAKSDRTIVYGTPNRQSTPGYAKLGFSVIDSSRSWLFFIPSGHNALRKLLRLGAASAKRTKSTSRFEIAAEDYIEATAAYPRLNQANFAYLRWRLRDAPMGYRFARIETRLGTFECAMRPGSLGDLEVVVIAEYFVNGAKPSVRRAAPFLRRLVSDLELVPNRGGIYLHGERPTGIGLLRLYAARVVPHRILPICSTGIEPCPDAEAWFGRFQLSDCDIG